MTPRLSTRKRGSLYQLLLVGGFSLWDFYIGPYAGGVRPFDLLGSAGAVLHGFVTRRATPYVSPWRRFGIAAIIAVVGWALFVTLFSDPATRWKPVVGILMGLTVLLALLAAPPSPRSLERITRVLLLVHATALVLQWAWYHGTGSILNFHAITGGDPRLMAAFFRPAGLFLEPSHFAVFMTMMLLVRLRVLRRLDAPAWIGIASVLLSLSLLGVLAVAYVLVRSRPVVGLSITGAVASIGVLLAASLPRDSILYALVLTRFENLGTDSSAQGRYGGFLSGGSDLAMTATDWIFGRGFGYEYVAIGSSSISFLVNAAGAVGLGVFVLAIGLASARGQRLAGSLDVAFLLLAAPFWTFPIWWWWLAAIVTARGRIVPRATRALRSAALPPSPSSLTHAAAR